MKTMRARATVDVYCECGWEGCDDRMWRPVDDLRVDDIVLKKDDRTRIAAYRAFAERGCAPEALIESSMPVRLIDGPMPWAFYESLPAADDSFTGITLRIPLEGSDLCRSRLDHCDYAVYSCVSDQPVRGAWRFQFARIEPSVPGLAELS
jgi:hypothetical protein